MSFSRTCKLVEQFLRDCQQRINNSTTTTTSSATTTAAAGQLMSGKSAAHTVVQQTVSHPAQSFGNQLTEFTDKQIPHKVHGVQKAAIEVTLDSTIIMLICLIVFPH
jgi:hypothetical protein